MKKKPLGLNQVDVNLCQLAIGAGKPLRYFEFGLQNNALMNRAIPEKVFRGWFLETCRRGLLTWATPEEGKDHFKHRRYVITERGWMAVADHAILVEKGDYHYYKNFDGMASTLNKMQMRNQNVQVQFRDRKEGISINELLRAMPKKVREKWIAANPGWRSQSS
jgi:hypothetical protein